MLEAKCPNCSKHAEVDDDLSFVDCRYCNYHESYENYIETMRGKVENMADNFHRLWKKAR